MATTFRRLLLYWTRYLSQLVLSSAKIHKKTRHAENFYFIRVGTEFYLSKILSEFSRKPCPKFYNFYPDKLVPQAKIPNFYPGSAHTPYVTFRGPGAGGPVLTESSGGAPLKDGVGKLRPEHPYRLYGDNSYFTCKFISTRGNIWGSRRGCASSPSRHLPRIRYLYRYKIKRLYVNSC